MVTPNLESRLVPLAQSGDRTALSQLLIEQHRRLIHHLKARMPPSAAHVCSPEDIAQQTYARVYCDLAQFEYRGEGSFYAWMRTIAERHLINTLKAHQATKRGGASQHVHPLSNSDSAMNLLNAIVSADETPSLKLRRQEAVDALCVALAELPEDYQEVVRRRFFQGQSLEDTAKGMGKTPAAVRALVDRAKKRLRRTLEDLSVFKILK